MAQQQYRISRYFMCLKQELVPASVSESSYVSLFRHEYGSRSLSCAWRTLVGMSQSPPASHGEAG
eukprot:scaffold2211_cov137-Isochrysis_galbana.AAC.2